LKINHLLPLRQHREMLAKLCSGVLYPQRVASADWASACWSDWLFRTRVKERALTHKYKVGETVYFTASNISRHAASGAYEVIRQLPTDGDDCQYRIKSTTEAFERVAKESQLKAA
jgi:hypothetical protein